MWKILSRKLVKSDLKNVIGGIEKFPRITFPRSMSQPGQSKTLWKWGIAWVPSGKVGAVVGEEAELLGLLSHLPWAKFPLSPYRLPIRLERGNWSSEKIGWGAGASEWKLNRSNNTQLCSRVALPSSIFNIIRYLWEWVAAVFMGTLVQNPHRLQIHHHSDFLPQ